MIDSSRIFLVVVDESDEMPAALRYAAWRARQSRGRVAMLHVIEPESIQPWAGVEETLTEAAEADARAELKEYEMLVESISGSRPLWFIRRGKLREVLLKLLEERPDISVLVLAAKTDSEGPGPLVSYLTSTKGLRALKIPLVIVPENYQVPVDKELL